ncbi:MAG: YciI family protein [Actinomycetota bacterium]|nr:YciI family protein [Actinomycetota bacterium]
MAFGPVLDPAGSWGLAIVQAEDEAEVGALGKADPAVTSGLATYGCLPHAWGDRPTKRSAAVTSLGPASPLRCIVSRTRRPPRSARR